MDGAERLQELAEMIGGQRITDTTRAQAQELLDAARAGVHSPASGTAAPAAAPTSRRYRAPDVQNWASAPGHEADAQSGFGDRVSVRVATRELGRGSRDVTVPRTLGICRTCPSRPTHAIVVVASASSVSPRRSSYAWSIRTCVCRTTRVVSVSSSS